MSGCCRVTVNVKIAFDGTDYCGSQIQENGRTVFEEFQKALVKILGESPDIKACSRTDSGVHARCFYLSFNTEKAVDVHKLPLSLNANLPFDIRVQGAYRQAEGFHARYSAKAKEYTYYIKNSHVDDPFCQKYYYRTATVLDAEKMNEAAQYFVGTQDFRSFMTIKSKVEDCVRTVVSASVIRQGDMVNFKITADGYLYNMVRIMAGTLMWVGTGRLEPQDVKEIIAAKDRSKAGVTAPAKGLFLTDVIY
ncbi:MAG: tRNA pseudouridine(38-40) synthase TruA [Oscillospiraceae bacterium]